MSFSSGRVVPVIFTRPTCIRSPATALILNAFCSWLVELWIHHSIVLGKHATSDQGKECTATLVFSRLAEPQPGLKFNLLCLAFSGFEVSE